MRKGKETADRGNQRKGSIAGSGKRKRQESTERESKSSRSCDKELDEDFLDSYHDDIHLGDEAADLATVHESRSDKPEGKAAERRNEDAISETGSSSSSDSISTFRGLGGGIKERANRILQKGYLYVHLQKGIGAA